MSASLPGQVFVVGMNGSGTTMLRDQLANHSWVYGFPFETRSLPYFIMHEHEYGDLREEENFLRLWNALKKSIAKRAGVLPDDMQLPDSANRTAAGAFDHIMRCLAQREGKRMWCEKTPMYVSHMPLLSEAFPNARFIHIIRDGRNCAASFHRRWSFNPVRTISRWKRVVRTGRADGRALGTRYCEVRYEAVTQAPEAAFRQLLEFLELPFEPAVLHAPESDPNDAGPQESEVRRNLRKAEDYFDPATSRKLEGVAGKLLFELGYACKNPLGDRDPSRWQTQWWRIADDMRRFVAVATREGRLFKPSKWRYIASRTRNAFKQRETSEL